MPTTEPDIANAHYCVISNEVLIGLEHRVNELISEGWSLQGGICAIPAMRISDGATIHAFYQAMYR